MGILLDYLRSKRKDIKPKAPLDNILRYSIISHAQTCVCQILKNQDSAMLEMLGHNFREDLNYFFREHQDFSAVTQFLNEIEDEISFRVSQVFIDYDSVKSGKYITVTNKQHDDINSAFPKTADLEWLLAKPERIANVHDQTHNKIAKDPILQSRAILCDGFRDILPERLFNEKVDDPLFIALSSAFSKDRKLNFAKALDSTDMAYTSIYLRFLGCLQDKSESDPKKVSEIAWQAAEGRLSSHFIPTHQYHLDKIQSTKSLMQLREDYTSNCRLYCSYNDDGSIDRAFKITSAKDVIAYLHSDTLLKRATLEQLDKICYVISLNPDKALSADNISLIRRNIISIFEPKADQLREYLSHEYSGLDCFKVDKDVTKKVGAGLPLKNVVKVIGQIVEKERDVRGVTTLTVIYALPLSAIVELVKSEHITFSDLQEFILDEYLISSWKKEALTLPLLKDLAALKAEILMRFGDNKTVVDLMENSAWKLTWLQRELSGADNLDYFVQQHIANNHIESINNAAITSAASVDTDFMSQIKI